MTLTQFELIQTDALRDFHMNQLKWATEAGFLAIPLQVVVPDEHNDPETIDFTVRTTITPEDRIHLFRTASFAHVAIADPRPRSQDAYNDVELEHAENGIRATCTCKWSREGWTDNRTMTHYPFRACSHIMAAIAALDPEIKKQLGDYLLEQATKKQKLDALMAMGAISLS
jgi:hypothetical protein